MQRDEEAKNIMQIDKRFLDPNWRLEHLYHIVNKSGQRVKFKPNNIQRLLLQSKSNRRMILKARQVGISTLELLRQSDFVFFNKNKSAMILAHEQDALDKLFRVVRGAYDCLHPQLKPVLDKGGGSRYELFFPEINSRISCDLENRGSTVHWLHISELAFVKDMDRVLATIESVPLNGIITIESTPQGLNKFYDMWTDLESNYEKLFFPWHFESEYKITNHDLTFNDLTAEELKFINQVKLNYKQDITLDQIAFRRFKQSELKNLFKQEYVETTYDCFLTSGNAPFQLEIIKPLYDAAPKPVEIINGIRIYERHMQGETYVIGADPAEGIGGDASAAHVFKVSNCQQVATFSSKSLKPSEFAEKLVEMSEIYTEKWPVLIGVERNNHGHAVLLKLDEVLDYPSLFKFHEDKFGWQTDKITRPLMLDAFIEGVENGTVLLKDRETLGECLTLINNNGKVEAEDNKHDDLVIAAAISIQMCLEERKLNIYSNISSKIRI